MATLTRQQRAGAPIPRGHRTAPDGIADRTFTSATGTKASQQQKSLTISIQHPAMALATPNRKINGYDALYRPASNDQLELFIGDIGVIISSHYRKDVRENIAASLTLAANLGDSSTWFDTMN
jgi:hypothetical protein